MAFSLAGAFINPFVHGFITDMGGLCGFITGMGAIYGFFTVIGAHTCF